MRTPNGKIGRLPETIREELNRRLADGEQAEPLLKWLNALPEVQAMLGSWFGGNPINEPNLSHWRCGGFQRWQQRRVRRTIVEETSEDVEELLVEPKAEEIGADMCKHFSRVLAADFEVGPN